MICRTISTATLFWASRVEAPKWGVRTTEFNSNKGLSKGFPSSKTSKAAPASFPALRAS